MGFKVFGIGEVLWDLLPVGPQLGGAPANFTYHVQHLGADASLITRVGNDLLGKKALQQFEEKSLSRNLIQSDKQHPTGTVGVEFLSPGIPNYTINENVAWDYLTATQQALAAISHADAVCFGSLSQRNPVSRGAIYALLLAAPQNALRVFDVNLRQPFFTIEAIERSLRLANVLKLNSDELDVLASLFHINGTLEDQITWLSQAYNLHTIALTLGSEGSMLYRQGNWSVEPSRQINVVDTIGAGDAFTAALVIGLLHELKLKVIHEFAVEISSYVCSQAGGMPPLPELVKARITELH